MITDDKKKLHHVICLLLFVITILAYIQVRNYPFISYDDEEYVYQNPFVLDGVTSDGVAWAFSTTHAANWHPVTWLSHMLDVQLFGLNAGGHHLVNVFFHALNTILLFHVLWRMTGFPWRSGFVAALFALHPLHVESVAWVAERKDVLSAFFWMLTMAAYVRYTEAPRFRRYVPILLFFILGLMTKPMLVTLPFVLLLLDYWPLGRMEISGFQPEYPGRNVNRKPLRILIAEKVPLIILSLASCTITYLAQRKSGAVASAITFPFGLRATNAVVSAVRYLEKTIWPASLSVFYPYDVDALSVWRISIAVVLISSLTLFGLRVIRRRPYVAVGWLWYLGTLIPVIGLVQIGEQSMADRYTYVPLIGIFILLIFGIQDLASRWRFGKYIVPALAVVMFSLLFTATWVQVGHWRNGVALFRHSLEVTSKNGIANNNLGKALMDEGRFGEAIPFFREAVRIKPDLYMAYSNLGIVLGRVGKFNEGIASARQALQLNPEDSGAYFGLGYALIHQGKTEEAIASYRRAFQVEPHSQVSLMDLGIDLAQQGKNRESIAILKEAVRMKPNDGYAYYNLGLALVLQGKTEEGAPYFQQALRLNPGDQQMVQKIKSMLQNVK